MIYKSVYLIVKSEIIEPYEKELIGLLILNYVIKGLLIKKVTIAVRTNKTGNKIRCRDFNG